MLTPGYTWDETDAGLSVHVEIRGITKGALSVTCTDCMLKVNHAPYLLVLDLHGEIDADLSTAAVTADGITCLLVKRHAGAWGVLVAVGDKAVLRARRDASIEADRLRTVAAKKAALDARLRAEKQSVERQITADDERRRAIDDAKAEELTRERASVFAWQAGGEGGEEPRRPGDDNESGYDDDGDGDDTGHGDDGDGEGDEGGAGGGHADAATPGGPGAGDGADDSDYEIITQREAADAIAAATSASAVAGALVTAAKIEAPPTRVVASVSATSPTPVPVLRPLPPPRAMPAPRCGVRVPVSFTKLEQDHMPARAPREKEIKMRKQMARGDGDAVDLTEREPVFLKDKGDAFAKSGNDTAAIAAYTRALDLGGGLPATKWACYANRASAHLRLKSWSRCVDDCDAALAVLGDVASEAATQGWCDVDRGRQVRLLARRGRARAEGGDVTDALRDYTSALALCPPGHPDEVGLRLDVDELKDCVAPLDGASLRRRGDVRAAAGDASGAVDAYALALATRGLALGDRLACRANRAGCYLAMGDFMATVEDCDAALAVLLTNPGAADASTTTEGGEESQGDAGNAADAAEASAAAILAGAGGGLELALHAALTAGPTGLKGRALAAAAKLLARRGAAFGHVKRYGDAARDYERSAAAHRAAGATEPAAAAEADEALMRRLAAGEENASAGANSVCGVDAVRDAKGTAASETAVESTPVAGAENLEEID